MVKADIKRDYYADLDLPPTADADEIKKQFRLLAKQYHPDRNPGHEVEVVPKFQAVQAAHEILIDPVEKQKYDQGRARLTAKTANVYAPDPYGFARANPSKPTAPGPQYGFPAPKQKDKRSPFPPPPQNQKPASTGADKFNAWTRSGPQTWDRSRFEAASAEAARGFSTMRPAQSNPPVPPRPPRQHPTAPKPAPAHPDNPHVPNVPPTSFPGLSRTQSARRTTGYMPGAQGGADEPAAPRSSAYAYVRAERPQGPPPTSPNINVSDTHNMRSPPLPRARPTVSPLRQTRSTDHDMRSDRVETSRPSSKYAAPGWERTDLHGDGLHRSASVRNSPVEPHWEDRGPFGRPTSHSNHHEQIPRHRSASPKVSSTGIHADYSSSSFEDEPPDAGPRPKAMPKRRPKPPKSGPSFQAFADDDPALTGQFPSTNYNKNFDESHHHYPPAEGREHGQKSWPDMASSDTEGGRHGFGGNGENMDGPKYASPRVSSSPWSQRLGLSRAKEGHTLNGVPSWAVPSSVYPYKTPPRDVTPIIARRSAAAAVNHSFNPLFGHTSPSKSNPANQGRSHEGKPNNLSNSTFVASEWHDKVTSEDFLPTDSHLRKSPSKTSRQSKPVPRGRGLSRAANQEGQSSSESSARRTDHHESKASEDAHSKAEAFQPGKLSSDWASKVRSSSARAQTGAASHQRKDDSDSAGSKERYVEVEEEEDVMDIDDRPMTGNEHHRASTNGFHQSVRESSRRSSKRQSMNGGVDLREFAQHAPFAPTATGLKGMEDLAANLPFESRPEDGVDLGHKASKNRKPRPLDLPRPPKCVVPPAEDRLTNENFTQYTKKMMAYMLEWNNFNAKMLEHFRRRQDMVCGNMLPNWISVRSDGPDAHEGEDGIQVAPSRPAGYATYMQWLQEDAECRQWWDHANELHMKCLEDLGRIREKGKRSLAH